MKTQRFLEMRGITKRFPNGVLANDQVDFTVNHGEIHGLVGENGAGKSTLMHILTGIHKPDGGEILLNGEGILLSSPADAIKHGIGMVYQHFMLIPELTVLDNLILGHEPLLGPLLNRSEATKQVREVMEQHQMDLPLDEQVQNLPVSTQQQVEILKCLLRKANVLVLDEPTSVLTPQESRSLFKALEALANSGVSIVFISHKLGEVLQLTQRITILRDGRVTGVVKTEETTERELARLMVGREINLPQRNTMLDKGAQGDRLLQVTNLSLTDLRGRRIIDSVDLSVSSGEVLGIAAISGNGQSELVELLVGLRKPSNGQIIFKNQDITNIDVDDRWEMGVSYIPQDTRGRGTAPWIGLAWNVAIRGHGAPPLSKGIILNERSVRQRTLEIIEQFNVKASRVDEDVSTLSGGNLQKVVVGRELLRNPSLLIAEDPTQGLDIGSIEQVRTTILDYASKGGSVVLVSQDLSEVLALSDRIVVMYEGRIVGERKSGDLDIEEIGLMMTGLSSDGEGKGESLNEDANSTTNHARP